MKTILVVDDKSSVRTLLQEYLREQGFRVVGAANGREAIYTARHELPDIILLDLMMPEMDGYEFLRQYRREKNTPVIIITAREEETDAVLGLELGADDYVVKPFRMRELVSRIRAVLRRIDGTSQPARVLRAGHILLDESTHSVKIADEPVHLTPMEFDLLLMLMSSSGRVFTREQIIDRLSQNGFAGLDRTLNVHIRNLRTKIESDPDHPEYIETVFGVGYRFRGLTEES
ncbi:MAG: response regulator transcription factor [Anaerolineaceae bacterium]|nr:response regulator transcription factor [Anaerolineaceae bacterium]